jgi:hypothetical protein
MRNIVRFCACAIAMALISPGFASELHWYLGGLHATPHSEPTYSWALEYRRPISEHLSGSFTWLNEGHVPGHHRDGQAIQLWWHTAPVNRGPIFQVGLGPYRYFDTTVASNADGYADIHGWGLVASAGATWHIGSRWLASLRINRVHVHNSIRSTAVVAGMGYRFGSTSDDASAAWVTSRTADSRRWELDTMAGATIVNSFDSDAELAKAIGLRVRATDHLAGSLTYLNEGDVRRGRRAGVAPQFWLEDHLTDRFSVGVGVGPYFALRKPRDSDGTSASPVSALISITAAYAITPEWIGRLIWNRVETRYDRDTDVVMFALGYRF